MEKRVVSIFKVEVTSTFSVEEVGSSETFVITKTILFDYIILYN
jgi:hypothetical protein